MSDTYIGQYILEHRNIDQYALFNNVTIYPLLIIIDVFRYH